MALGCEQASVYRLIILRESLLFTNILEFELNIELNITIMYRVPHLDLI